MVLPVLQISKTQLHSMKSGIITGSPFADVNSLKTYLSDVTLWKKIEIPVYELWSAACVLNPGLYTFPFSSKSMDFFSIKAKGEALMRPMNKHTMK